MGDALRVLMITSEWPTPQKPYDVPFVVRQVEFLRKAGIEVNVLAFHGGRKPQNYARAWLKAWAEISTGQYDLVHAQWGQSGLLALPKRIPLVVTFRGDDLNGITDPDGKLTKSGVVLQNLSRLVARTADQIIVVSENLARLLPDRAYHIIPSGLDLDLFCPAPQELARNQLDLDPDRKYVLFAGSASRPGKRYPLAQEAVQLLKQEMDVELLVVKNVTHDKIPVFMNASDVLLMTSLHEGSPNVVKEALACNLPVVSTDVGDVRYRIGKIPGCAVLADDQPETIATTLRKVLRRGERVDSRPTVVDLDENILSQKVIRVYQNALANQ